MKCAIVHLPPSSFPRVLTKFKKEERVKESLLYFGKSSASASIKNPSRIPLWLTESALLAAIWQMIKTFYILLHSSGKGIKKKRKKGIFGPFRRRISRIPRFSPASLHSKEKEAQFISRRKGTGGESERSLKQKQDS